MQSRAIKFYLLLIINLAYPLNLLSQKSTKQKKEALVPKKKVDSDNVIEIKSITEIDQYLPAVLQFYTDDCGACVRFKEHFEKLAKKYPKIKFLKVNGIKYPALTQAYKIMSLPSFVFLANNSTSNFRMVIGPKKRELESGIELLIKQTSKPTQPTNTKSVKVNVQDLSSFAELEKLVHQANKLVVAEYHAERRCGHCKVFAQKLIELADEHNDVAIFVKLDAMEPENQALSQKYKISGVPTTFIFKSGDLEKPIAIVEGNNKEQLHSAICKAANKPETTDTKTISIITEIFGQKELDNLIKESNVPVIVDYHAESWCRACKIYKDIFTDFAKNHPNLKFVKVDGNRDENKVIGNIYKIESLPTTLVFENGKNTDRIIGINPKIQETLTTLSKKVS